MCACAHAKAYEPTGRESTGFLRITIRSCVLPPREQEIKRMRAYMPSHRVHGCQGLCSQHCRHRRQDLWTGWVVHKRAAVCKTFDCTQHTQIYAAQIIYVAQVRSRYRTGTGKKLAGNTDAHQQESRSTAAAKQRILAANQQQHAARTAREC